MTWRGVFSGALALIALEAVLRTDQSASRVGGMLTGVAGLVNRALSPDVPLIPDLRENVAHMGPPAKAAPDA